MKKITMKNRLLFIFAIVSMFTGCSVSRYSGTAKPENNTGETATLIGSVWNVDNGEPVLGVNVILLDANDVLRYGAATDKNGEYQIEGVSYGKYTVRFAMLGYYDKEIVIDIKKDQERLCAGLKEKNIMFD
ncbi:MAG: carboxypeptidase-like regulatory domain-containing protein [Bacteroidales bacterium]|nr:carboxypeptidase-like regulatory domain-containing protein [Bacteroidales bacterium]